MIRDVELAGYRSAWLAENPTPSEGRGRRTRLRRRPRRRRAETGKDPSSSTRSEPSAHACCDARHRATDLPAPAARRDLSNGLAPRSQTKHGPRSRNRRPTRLVEELDHRRTTALRNRRRLSLHRHRRRTCPPALDLSSVRTRDPYRRAPRDPLPRSAPHPRHPAHQRRRARQSRVRTARSRHDRVTIETYPHVLPGMQADAAQLFAELIDPSTGDSRWKTRRRDCPVSFADRCQAMSTRQLVSGLATWSPRRVAAAQSAASALVSKSAPIVMAPARCTAS